MSLPKFVEVPLADWQNTNSQLVALRENCISSERRLLEANARLAVLKSALADSIAYVENLAGKDNSCDPGCDEELKEWRKLLT